MPNDVESISGFYVIRPQFGERRRVVTVVTVFWDILGTLFKQNITKSNIYPCSKRVGMVTNLGSKYI